MNTSVPVAADPSGGAGGRNGVCIVYPDIAGRTVAELMEDGPLPEVEAGRITRDVCIILKDLHSLPTPVIHRDIKPSNIMIAPEGTVFLLDMNVAKWYDPEQKDDTRYLGTRHFAAPEQAGYGLTSSSPKSDIYAVGILLNVMVTGKYLKEQKAGGSLWSIIERCISLDAKKRYTAEELIEQLECISG